MARALRMSALALLGTAASATTPKALTLPDVSKLTADSITFLPFADEKCGTGTQMYYAIITPKKVTSPKKFWVESMGGAVCFDKDSCQDTEYKVWLDLIRIIERYVKFPIPGFANSAVLFATLTSGNPLPLTMVRPLKMAYLPNGVGGPLDGQVGFFYPTCTGDTGLGNYKVTYPGPLAISHTGGASYMLLLEAIKKIYADATHVTMIGASGSAVSRVAWAPSVADMFPQAEVRVLADSAFHVLPATEVYNYFWANVQWSPNPNAKHDLATKYATGMTNMPKFDWTSPSAITDMLNKYKGRVKLLYIGCNNDAIVVADREGLSKYAKLTLTNIKETIETEMWDFLQKLTQNAPANSAFSYISKGTCHHQTRVGWESAINANNSNDKGPEAFTQAFLKGETQNPSHIWCCGKVPLTSTFEASSAVSTVPFLAALALAAAWA